MKTINVLIIVIVGLIGISSVVKASNDSIMIDMMEQCEYTADDASKDLNDLKIKRFVPKDTSDDGQRIMGMILYHDPKNLSKDSVDAAAIVIMDKALKSRVVFLAILYYNSENQTITTYKRKINVVNGKKTPSLCFDRVISKVSSK